MFSVWKEKIASGIDHAEGLSPDASDCRKAAAADDGLRGPAPFETHDDMDWRVHFGLETEPLRTRFHFFRSVYQCEDENSIWNTSFENVCLIGLVVVASCLYLNRGESTP